MLPAQPAGNFDCVLRQPFCNLLFSTRLLLLFLSNMAKPHANKKRDSERLPPASNHAGSKDSDSDAQAPSRYEPSSGLRILVVKDNEVNQRVVVAYIKKLGHQADVVTNGLEAIEAYELPPMTWYSWIYRCRKWMVWKRLALYGTCQ